MSSWTLRVWLVGCVALGAVACDDGGDGGTNDAGGGGDAGPNLDAECTSTFEGWTLGQLLETAADTGECISESDIEDICLLGPGDAAAEAGSACWLGTDMDAEMAAACVLEAIRERTPDLSESCQSCFSDVVICTADNCTFQCAQDATAEVCTTCRIEEGCRPDFFACTGLINVDENDPE